MSCYPRNYIYIDMCEGCVGLFLCVYAYAMMCMLYASWQCFSLHIDVAHQQCQKVQWVWGRGCFVLYAPALSPLIMLMMLCVTGRLWRC